MPLTGAAAAGKYPLGAWVPTHSMLSGVKVTISRTTTVGTSSTTTLTTGQTTQMTNAITNGWAFTNTVGASIGITKGPIKAGVDYKFSTTSNWANTHTDAYSRMLQSAYSTSSSESSSSTTSVAYEAPASLGAGTIWQWQWRLSLGPECPEIIYNPFNPYGIQPGAGGLSQYAVFIPESAGTAARPCCMPEFFTTVDPTQTGWTACVDGSYDLCSCTNGTCSLFATPAPSPSPTLTPTSKAPSMAPTSAAPVTGDSSTTTTTAARTTTITATTTTTHNDYRNHVSVTNVSNSHDIYHPKSVGVSGAAAPASSKPELVATIVLGSLAGIGISAALLYHYYK